MESILKNCSISRLANAAAAGQTDVESSLLDMRGYQRATVIAVFGSITAGGGISLQVQTGDLSNGSDMANITGALAEGDSDDDNRCLVVEVANVTGRYIRGVVSRSGQDSVVDAILAIRSGGQYHPETQPASVADSTLQI